MLFNFSAILDFFFFFHLSHTFNAFDTCSKELALHSSFIFKFSFLLVLVFKIIFMCDSLIKKKKHFSLHLHFFHQIFPHWASYFMSNFLAFKVFFYLFYFIIHFNFICFFTFLKCIYLLVCAFSVMRLCSTVGAALAGRNGIMGQNEVSK